MLIRDVWLIYTIERVWDNAKFEIIGITIPNVILLPQITSERIDELFYF